MVVAAEPGRVCFLRDVEAFRSPAEFIEGIYADVQPLLSKTERAKMAMWGLLEKLGGVEIKDLKLPKFRPQWKNILLALFDDIFAEESRQVIFFWDELPLLVYNVLGTCGWQDAAELLDVLRSLRQKHADLRMVFTGSVGIHQVIARLRAHGYANDPTNDMAIIEVPPIDPADGSNLARLLLEGESIKVLDDLAETCQAISGAAGHIPYYIHWIVARFLYLGLEIRVEDVTKSLRELIADPDDPAHFQYYQTRLNTYYGPTESTLALHALDALATRRKPLDFATLLNLVRHQVADVEPEVFRQVLQVLQKDHYLVRRDDGNYAFRYSIVEQWWVSSRT